MSIIAGNDIVASDFVTTSAGSGDSGKVPKLNASGKLDGSFGKIGGSGADGALTITSGTTTIDCANASIVSKNYTSISITGTGKLAFSNPATNGTIVHLRSQGNVTLTSSQAPMIDMSAMGADSATDGFGLFFTVNRGLDGAGSPPSAGVGGTRSSTIPFTFVNKSIPIYTGAGGGYGQQYTGGLSVAGGRGGGGLFIECGGAWNFTTAGGISVAGQNGAAANSAQNSGGGGGGGGFFLCLYSTLTANSGTVTISGGTGGVGGGSEAGGAGGNSTTGGTGTGGNGGAGNNGAGGGGGGGSMFTNANGSNGTGGGINKGGAGAGGASGFSSVQANNDFF